MWGFHPLQVTSPSGQWWEEQLGPAGQPHVWAWCNVCTPQFSRLQLWPQLHSPEQVREAGSALLPKLGLRQQVLSGSVLYDHFQVVGQVRERERCRSEWHEEPAWA